MLASSKKKNSNSDFDPVDISHNEQDSQARFEQASKRIKKRTRNKIAPKFLLTVYKMIEVK